MGLRQLIVSRQPSHELCDGVEVDESYFGDTGGKVAVFVFLRRGGRKAYL